MSERGRISQTVLDAFDSAHCHISEPLLVHATSDLLPARTGSDAAAVDAAGGGYLLTHSINRGGRMYARLYAKVAGVIIVLIGVGGLLLGEKSLFGILNIDIAEDAIHLITGGMMAGVGFRGSDRAVRSVVGGLGVVYLLVGVLGFFVPDLFGLLPHEYHTVLDNLIHLSLGVLGVAVGFFLGQRPVAQSSKLAT